MVVATLLTRSKLPAYLPYISPLPCSASNARIYPPLAHLHVFVADLPRGHVGETPKPSQHSSILNFPQAMRMVV